MFAPDVKCGACGETYQQHVEKHLKPHSKCDVFKPQLAEPGDEGRSSLVATVYPVCFCGLPYPSHPDSACVGYTPKRPVAEIQTQLVHTHASLKDK